LKISFFLCIVGASFQIDSCTYDPADNLWRIVVQATDKGAALAAEYIEYQKKKMVEGNVVLMFGHLLLEMGNYAKAQKYFDTILSSSNPNDEEIACIYFNFGRTHRLNAEFSLAIDCYTRAYNLHIGAKPKRLTSAAKTITGLGILYGELNDQAKAKKCFERAFVLYKKSIPRKHVDFAGILINLGTIDLDQGEVKIDD
jgi:tetratricopeptide (TPR) repeat protein